MKSMASCCMFIQVTGSRLDRGLDKGNMRIFPLRLMILRKSTADSRYATLPSKNVLPENKRHPSIGALPLRGDYKRSSWSGRLVT